MSKRFIYFDGESKDAIIAQLSAGPVKRIEIHGEGEHTFIQVIPAHLDGLAYALADCPPAINAAHVCPGSPDCPPT